MNLPTRCLAFPLESIVYGPAYGTLQFMIRSPTPLDPVKTWDFIVSNNSPVLDWMRVHWPLWFLRKPLVGAK